MHRHSRVAQASARVLRSSNAVLSLFRQVDGNAESRSAVLDVHICLGCERCVIVTVHALHRINLTGLRCRDDGNCCALGSLGHGGHRSGGMEATRAAAKDICRWISGRFSGEWSAQCVVEPESYAVPLGCSGCCPWTSARACFNTSPCNHLCTPFGRLVWVTCRECMMCVCRLETLVLMARICILITPTFSESGAMRRIVLVLQSSPYGLCRWSGPYVQLCPELAFVACDHKVCEYERESKDNYALRNPRT
jgi:hypothetical protein